MQPRLRFYQWKLSFLLIAVFAAVATPQSHNREAMKWFDAGLVEKNIDKRIEAYNAAIALDPDFAEALLNLGAAHKERKNYERAEQFFSRAANASKGELRVKALSELASIYNIRGNSKSAESTLREAKKLAGDAKLRTVLSYELGRLLYQQGRYEQAVTELKDSRAGDPAKREAFDNLIALAENSSQLDDLYTVAARQRAAGNLKEAQAALEKIRAKNANFRDVQAQLQQVQALLATESNQSVIAAAPPVTVPPVVAPPAADTLAASNIEAEKAYAEGLVAIRKRDWAGAIAAFEKTLQLQPEHREAQQKLAGAQMYFERDNIEVIAARYYDEGVAAWQRHQLDSALVLLGKVHKINRRYRDVESLYAQVQAAQKQNAAIATATPPLAEPASAAPDTLLAANLLPAVVDSMPTPEPVVSVVPQLDSLYQAARAAIAAGNWDEAVLNLQKIRMQQENYRDVDQLFAAARSRMLEASAATHAPTSISLNRPSPLVIGGLALGAAVFFAIGFFFFSPTVRARYQSRRGNHEAAAMIYESLLAQRPSRLKLYSRLAEVYLKLERRDETALQIYRRVLELDLPSAHRADMNAIVALHTTYEKTADGTLMAKTEPVHADKPRPGNGVLLVDDGFHVQEKPPARRTRKKKEPLDGAAAAVVSEKGELLMDGAFAAPKKPRKPRKKKDAVAEGSAENGAPLAAHVEETAELPIKTPVRKPRRRVVEASSANGAPAHAEQEITVTEPKIDLPAPTAAAAQEAATV